MTGVYAWVTLNFLLGNLHPAEHRPQTVAIVDLGGASMQIAMLPTVEHALNELSDEHTATITTPRGEMTVYQHSFLGYGLNEARKTHITLNTVAVRQRSHTRHVHVGSCHVIEIGWDYKLAVPLGRREHVARVCQAGAEREL